MQVQTNAAQLPHLWRHFPKHIGNPKNKLHVSRVKHRQRTFVLLPLFILFLITSLPIYVQNLPTLTLVATCMCAHLMFHCSPRTSGQAPPICPGFAH
eukprot:5168377-Amphidinium_carterae.1